MTSRFWFLTYNIILIPLLSVVVKILATFHSKINESIEKREACGNDWKRQFRNETGKSL